MKEKDISIAHVYASPSLRCVESACSLLQGQLNCTILQMYWIRAVKLCSGKYVLNGNACGLTQVDLCSWCKKNYIVY